MEDEKDSGKLKSCHCKNIVRRITKIPNVELALSFSIRAATWGVFKQTLKNRRKSEKGVASSALMIETDTYVLGRPVTA